MIMPSELGSEGALLWPCDCLVRSACVISSTGIVLLVKRWVKSGLHNTTSACESLKKYSISLLVLLVDSGIAQAP